MFYGAFGALHLACGGAGFVNAREKIMDPVYQFNLTIPDDVVDENRHVNNVAYVKWMQDAAIRHSETTGCTQATLETGATWVVRTHVIEYHRPAFAGEELTVLTWVANFRQVRSLRRYKFIRSKTTRYWRKEKPIGFLLMPRAGVRRQFLITSRTPFRLSPTNRHCKNTAP